jgi:hypothetical protein
MAIVPSQELVYYHKLRKILESYSVYPNLIQILQATEVALCE